MELQNDSICTEVYQYLCVLLQRIGLKYSSIDVCNNFKKSKNVICTITKVYPKFFGSISEGIHEAIIIEDMTAAGYKILDSTKPVDYNHVMLVMKEYGKLHALSYALRNQKPVIFQELTNNLKEEYFSGDALNSYKSGFRVTLTRALEAIDVLKYRIAHEKYSIFLEHLDNSIKKVMKIEDTGGYAVIGHGDCWINNILFKYNNQENSNIPTEACLIDWQFSRFGSPALDISYFLFSSTDRKTREKLYLNLNTHKEENNTNKEKDRVLDLLTFESSDMSAFNMRARDLILDFVRLGYDMY
ncbi:hypothetical protein FQR65_LT07662 [Abscondita terminalis]|nr:hypothetical protein FQR65_LT07662 [Abscondita terminalis]